MSILALLYKSIHNKVATDTDYYQAKSEGGGITTRKSSSISFNHPMSNKDSYKTRSFRQKKKKLFGCTPPTDPILFFFFF